MHSYGHITAYQNDMSDIRHLTPLVLGDDDENEDGWRRDGKGDGERRLQLRTPRDPNGTRQKLLDAGFAEIRRAGVDGASIANIIDLAGVTKGALYHHFRSKAQLANAVIDECLPAYIDDIWLDALAFEQDVLPVLMAQVDRLGTRDAPEILNHGCPLARLASGADNMDDATRKRVDSVYRYWRRGLAGHISRSQFGKYVRTDIQASSVAEFIMAILHGYLSRPPVLRSSDVHAAFAGEYARYLSSLRP